MQVNLRFEEIENMPVYELLIEVCSEFAIEPSMSTESEDFFMWLLEQYPGSDDDLTALAEWVRNEIPKYFQAVRHYPIWIQSAQWPFDPQGRPMIFADQIDIEDEERNKFNPPLFHDGTSLYVFIGKKIAPVVVMQQY